ncbi:MAG: Holliday junction resolvase RuvX [Rhodoluna sp.]|nr:Holliday junction resolvase RuvX [Rhodoluna sp.]MBP7818796.1 Holliday junction resolvase RuvX [Rhodoluna sp.]
MRSGRRLAVDVGKVRVGLAISDFHGILASPLQNVNRQEDDAATIAALIQAIAGEEIIEVYFGLPVSMSGKSSASTDDAIALAQAFRSASSIPVRMIDERLTTVSATSALRSSGKNSKEGRKVIDQIAATMILEQALTTEKNLGQSPGVPLEELNV